jgi:hypothetical protein
MSKNRNLHPLIKFLIWAFYLFTTFSVSLYFILTYTEIIDYDRFDMTLILLFCILSIIIFGELILKNK